MHRLTAICLLGMILLVVGSIAGAQTPAPAQTPAQVEDPPPVLAVPQGYTYVPKGRRDPFVNPVPKPKNPEPEIPVIRPPGLKGVLVTEAKLMGVVTSKEPAMNKAVLQAPGNKIYFAIRGDSLFDAVVKEIRPDSVVFLLAPPKVPQSQATSREVVRRVNPVPGEKQ